MPRSSKMTEEEREWKAKSDMRTLLEAEEIKRDKTRLKAAQAMAKKEREALGKVENAGKET